MLYVLLGLLVLEWVLISQPIVEVGSAWLDMKERFTVYELQGSNSLMFIVALLHLISLAVILIPVITKRKAKAFYYIPSLITSVLSIFLFAQVAMRLDSLITDTALGDLIQLVSVDVTLTTASMALACVAFAVCAVSIYLIVCAGREEVGASADEKINKKTWRGPLLEKGNLLEAAAVLAAICIVVSAGLAVPMLIKSVFGSPIVGTWYVETDIFEITSITFCEDNTCEIAGEKIGYTWKTVDDSLLLEDSLGGKEIYDYEIDGENLIIEGVTLTRHS